MGTRSAPPPGTRCDRLRPGLGRPDGSRSAMTAAVVPDPRVHATITVEQVAAIYGIGRGLAYELARRGELPGARRLGSRWVVVTAEVVKDLGLGVATGQVDGER